MARKTTPTDEECRQAWAEIMRTAEGHCLIVQAYGGVATLAMPEEQRRAGLRAKCLMMANMVEAGEEKDEETTDP